MLTSQEFRTLLDRSMNELRLKTQGHQGGWGFGTFARWDFDQDIGSLIFSNPDGLQATCPAQIIGSFDTISSTWLWAWANPSIDDHLKRDAAKVQQFGQQNKIERLVTDTWKATLDDAWQMAALSVNLCNAQGAYCGPADTTLIFITFSGVTLSKNNR